MYQQGDVVLVPIKKIPADLEKVKASVLQEGEATGHAHRLHGDGFEIYAPKGPYNNDTQRKHLRLLKPVSLKHEEHKEIELPPGDYEVRIVREYDHFEEEARRVAD
jgi:hypothetical protein